MKLFRIACRGRFSWYSRVVGNHLPVDHKIWSQETIKLVRKQAVKGKDIKEKKIVRTRNRPRRSLPPSARYATAGTVDPGDKTLSPKACKI